MDALAVFNIHKGLVKFLLKNKLVQVHPLTYKSNWLTQQQVCIYDEHEGSLTQHEQVWMHNNNESGDYISWKVLKNQLRMISYAF